MRSPFRKYTAVASACLALALMWVPANADALADCQWARNDPEIVVEGCTRLLRERRGAKAWMHFNRGLAYKLLALLDEAERDYTRAIELDPKYAVAYANRGNVRALRNDLAGALADYRKAIKIDPKDEITRKNLKAIEAALRKIGVDPSGKGATSAPTQ